MRLKFCPHIAIVSPQAMQDARVSFFHAALAAMIMIMIMRNDYVMAILGGCKKNEKEPFRTEFSQM